MRGIAIKATSVFAVLLSFVALCAINSNGADPRQQLALANSDPSRLLPIYAAFVGITFAVLLAFSGRGIWWSLVDAACIAGLLSVSVCPILWVATRNWQTALAIGLSGLLTLAGTTVLYWTARKMPAKQSVFRDESDDDEQEEEAE